jgi:hypothetical protein
MKFDVATFNSLCLMTFLCSAVVTTALSRMFAEMAAFRFWALAFFLIAAAAGCFALHSIWPTKVLLLFTATLALQSRILIWSGTRALFGMPTPWRTGLMISAVFCALYALVLSIDAAPVYRAALFTLFFLPCRAATLYEVCRRRRPDLGAARMLVALGSGIVTLNTVLPLTLVLSNRANLSLLTGDPRTTSSVYAVVFAGDLLLTIGLIVLALQHLMIERDMLAALDRGASQQLNAWRPAPR